MRSGIVSLIFAVGLGFAFFAGQQAESQDSKADSKAAATCPHCAAKHEEHGKYHHGEPHVFEYTCLVGSKDRNEGKRASDDSSSLNKLGEEGWRLATHEGNQLCFMRHKK